MSIDGLSTKEPKPLPYGYEFFYLACSPAVYQDLTEVFSTQFSQNWAYLITSKLRLYPLGVINPRNGSVLDQLDRYLTRTRSNTGNKRLKTVFDLQDQEPPSMPLDAQSSQYAVKSFAECQNTAFGNTRNAEEFLILLYDGVLTNQQMMTAMA